MKDISFAGLSLLQPMYYEYPESSEAYSFDRQVLHIEPVWLGALLYMDYS